MHCICTCGICIYVGYVHLSILEINCVAKYMISMDACTRVEMQMQAEIGIPKLR